MFHLIIMLSGASVPPCRDLRKSAMPPKADLFALGHPRPLSAINGHRFASATVRPNQNDDESDEASTI